ncbi:MAG: class I SAM-dependent methyltransferase [Candidatus Omnitrophica bacterium]|nr:class I SAM-dependent methyltransferase [Candidatus Omnitrophota bacterium]
MAQDRSNNILAREQDWNKYWRMDNVRRGGQLSWSKKRIVFLLQSFLGRKQKILDAGCGSGFFSKHFYDLGHRVCSLDYSQEALKSTQQLTNNKTHLICKDMLADDFCATMDSDYDVIFSDGLLEHFGCSQQQRILGHFSQILSEKGMIVTFVPNKWSPWQLIRPFYMPGIKESPFVLSGLLRLHFKCNLLIIQSGGVNVLPFRFSPEKIFGQYFGMLLYAIARKKT